MEPLRIGRSLKHRLLTTNSGGSGTRKEKEAWFAWIQCVVSHCSRWGHFAVAWTWGIIMQGCANMSVQASPPLRTAAFSVNYHTHAPTSFEFLAALESILAGNEWVSGELRI